MFPAEVRLRGVPGMEATEELFALFWGAADSTGAAARGVHTPTDSSRWNFWEGGGRPDAYERGEV